MCAFYRDHRQADSARDLAQYVSLALFLGEAPKFALKAREADLPPDASYVLGFVPLLARFAQAANLHKVWQEHRYQYDELIERFHEPVSKMILSTDVYLQLPLSGYVGRSFTVYLEPMAASGQVNARNYGADYSMVVSPAGKNLRIDQIRHTYLHFILDPLILKRANEMARMTPLLKTVQKAPLDEVHKKDISLLVTESMIRAVEARLAASGKNADPVRQREADKAMAEGYVLTRYFYEQLIKFETEPTGLRDALPDWLYYLDVGRESKRAENVRFAPAAAPEVLSASKLSASNSQAGLLDLAEQRLDAGDYDGAHKLAEQALDQKKEDAGRALFILARAASMNKDMRGARDYFERTVQVAHDPRLRAWAHIYLGRISDHPGRPAGGAGALQGGAGGRRQHAGNEGSGGTRSAKTVRAATSMKKHLRRSRRPFFRSLRGERMMKRLLLLMVLMAMAATLVQAQTGSAPNQPTVSPGQSPQTGNQPAKQGTPAEKAPPPMSTNGKPMPQAKSQEEFKAYQEAVSKTNPAEVEAAADDFATKFPSKRTASRWYIAKRCTTTRTPTTAIRRSRWPRRCWPSIRRIRRRWSPLRPSPRSRRGKPISTATSA